MFDDGVAHKKRNGKEKGKVVVEVWDKVDMKKGIEQCIGDVNRGGNESAQENHFCPEFDDLGARGKPEVKARADEDE
jgi:hypothetical protein